MISKIKVTVEVAYFVIKAYNRSQLGTSYKIWLPSEQLSA